MSTPDLFTQDELDRRLDLIDRQAFYDPAEAAEYARSFESWIAAEVAGEQLNQTAASKFLTGTTFILARSAYVDGEVDVAIDLFLTCVQHAEAADDARRQILALRLVAACYEYVGMQVESTSRIFEAIDRADELGDPWVQGVVLYGLAALYEAQGAYEQTLETAFRAHDIAVANQDAYLLCATRAGVGLSYGYLGQWEDGIEWIEKGLEVSTNGALPQLHLYLHLYLIFLYQGAGRVEQAVELAETYLPDIARLPAQNQAATYVDLAEVHVAAQNLDRADEMLQLAVASANGERLKAHLIRYYKVAADVAEGQGDDAKALKMMRSHAELDSQFRGRDARARLVAVERHFAQEIAAKTEEIQHLRTVELVEKNQQLSDLVQQKDEILHVVVHDLRNPLAAAQLLGESLVLDLSQSVTDDALDRLRSIGDAAIEMRETVDTLLASQRNEPGSTPTPVAEAVHLAVEDARKRSGPLNVGIDETSTDVDLIVNSALLRRSLDDLLQNAVESSKPDTVLTVSLEPVDGGGARIIIAGDHVRFDEQTTEGRSLYIARRLVERMRGSISLDSSPDDTLTTATIDLRP